MATSFLKGIFIKKADSTFYGARDKDKIQATMCSIYHLY